VKPLYNEARAAAVLQDEGSGWLLRYAQGELWCLHELQDGALDERRAVEEHQLRRRRRGVIHGGAADELKKKGQDSEEGV
jgi:hypothetical protein